MIFFLFCYTGLLKKSAKPKGCNLNVKLIQCHLFFKIGKIILSLAKLHQSKIIVNFDKGVCF